MAKKSTKIATIPAPTAFYIGSGSYVFLRRDGEIIAADRISSDVIHPSCVGPDSGSYRTNGGAAYEAAVAFAAAHEGECFLAVGSSYEFMHVTPFR